MNKRVQVRDLAPPERIEPTPIKRDTYVPVRSAGMNPNWEYLMRGLSAFKQGATHMAAVAEKKQLEEYRKNKWAEYQAWRASTTNAAQVEAIRTGKSHWTSDPVIGAAVRKDYGQMEAQALSEEMDREIAAQSVNLANPDFNIERYVLEKAAPYVERLKTSPEAMGAFRAGMDVVRNGLIAKHQKARGEAAVAQWEDISRRRLSAVFDNSLKEGHLGDSHMAAVRSVYKELGPRTKGGAFDLSYSRMDELLLDVLKEKAQDPRYANAVIDMVNADRRDLDTKAPLGSLAKTVKHSATIREILARAVKTRDDHWEKQTKEGLTLGLMEAFRAGDGSFNAGRDLSLENPYDPSKRLKINIEELKKEAATRWLDKTRRESGFNLDNEMMTFMRNDVEHPLVTSQMKSAYFGVLNMNFQNGKPGPGDESRLAQVAEAADTFTRMHNINPVYVEKHLGKEPTKFFEAIKALRESGVATPQEAALLALKSNSNPAAGQLSAADLRKIDQAVAPGGTWPFTSKYNQNSPELKRQLTDSVRTLTKFGVPFDQALKQAKTAMEKNAVNINGHMVWGVQNVTPATAPVIQSALKDMFTIHQLKLKAQDINSPEDLTVVNYNGNLYAANAKTGRVVFITKQPNLGGPGEPEQFGQPQELPLGVITNNHITKGQAATEKLDTSTGVEKAIRSRDFYDAGRQITQELETNIRNSRPNYQKPGDLPGTIRDQARRVREGLKRFNEPRDRVQPPPDVGDN